MLLLDEPFGALDAKVRQGLRAWLRRLHDEIHVTSILVTHDQEEALEVADRVVVMNHGQIEQIGTPEEVFHKPATQFVMEFLGQVNVFHGRVQGGKAMLGEVALDGHYFPGKDEGAAMVYMRPHELDIKLYRNGAPSFPATGHAHQPGRLDRQSHDANRRRPGSARRPEPRRLPTAEPDRRQRTCFIYPKNTRVFLAGVRNLEHSTGKETRHDRWRSHRDGANFTINPKHRPRTARARADDALNQIRDSLRGLRFGSVNIIVQDGVIIQIDRTEKRRLRGNRNNST